MMFDTLAPSRALKAANFPSDQAEGLADAINVAAVDTIATKQDLLEMRSELKLGQAELKVDLVRWIAGALVAQNVAISGLVIALVKLIH